MHSYPSFIDDTQFDAMHAERSHDEQLGAMLQNLKQVFAITTQKYDDLSQLIHAILEAGTNIFGLETGIVSQIEGDEYLVLDVVSPLDAIARHDVFPVEGTYCREVVDSGKVLGFPHVGELLFMQDHPVYQNLKLESYLSAPIWIDGRIVGTLNFTSQAPRANGFSEHERDLITLMADAIATFILVRDREDKLTAANRQLKKFVGFVAHDLRNPLGAIESLAKMGAKPNAQPARRQEILGRVRNLATVTLEFVHSVLELSALGAGKLAPQLTTFPLRHLLTFTEASLEELLTTKHSHITIQCDESVTVRADVTLLRQVIANLLANAIKYAPERSRIEVTAHIDGTNTITTVTNEIRPLTHPEQEPERYRSVGFGLDIAHEILSAHHTELTLSDTGTHFTASFTLPTEQAPDSTDTGSN